MKHFLYFSLFLLISCNDVAPNPEINQGPIEIKGRWSNALYDKFLSDALINYGQDLLKVVPVDYKDFINEWPLTQNGVLVFWHKVIVEMAYYESGWRASTQYQEDFKDQKGEDIISRGLMQLSIESGKSYGCPLKIAEDLHDPQINLECAVRILNRWVVRDGRIAGKVDGQWRGGARYWSVLRQEIGVPKKSTDAIKKANK